MSTSVDQVTVDPRSELHFKNLVHINEALNQGAILNYMRRGLIYVDVPTIVGITGACENVDTLFTVGNRQGLPLFFNQTGQLALEPSLQHFPGAYTIITSGRDEEYEDDRHLRQFRLTEEEFDCTLAGMAVEGYDEEVMFEALLNNLQGSVQSMIRRVLKGHSGTLESGYGRNISELTAAATEDFGRVSYEDAIGILNQRGYEDLKFGDDLTALHEQEIVKAMSPEGMLMPVFITRYPVEIKFFNMKRSKRDPRVVLSADLILPYAGEAAGSAVREHEFESLNERLLTSRMFQLHQERGGTYEDFEWYLKIIREGKIKPHAGYGIGNDRVMQFLLGTSDIREASIFAQFGAQTGDWSHKVQ